MASRHAVTPHVLTVEETAEALRLSVRQVRRLIAERRIPYVRVGRAVRIDPNDLAALIRSSRVEPITPTAAWSHMRRAA